MQEQVFEIIWKDKAGKISKTKGVVDKTHSCSLDLAEKPGMVLVEYAPVIMIEFESNKLRI